MTFRDGRVETFDRVDPLLSGWLRCVRFEPSPRMGFDETMTYYHQDDVAREVLL